MAPGLLVGGSPRRLLVPHAAGCALRADDRKRAGARAVMTGRRRRQQAGRAAAGPDASLACSRGWHRELVNPRAADAAKLTVHAELCIMTWRNAILQVTGTAGKGAASGDGGNRAPGPVPVARWHSSPTAHCMHATPVHAAQPATGAAGLRCGLNTDARRCQPPPDSGAAGCTTRLQDRWRRPRSVLRIIILSCIPLHSC